MMSNDEIANSESFKARAKITGNIPLVSIFSLHVSNTDINEC